MIILEKQTFKNVAHGEPQFKQYAQNTYSDDQGGIETMAKQSFLILINSSILFHFSVSLFGS